MEAKAMAADVGATLQAAEATATVAKAMVAEVARRATEAVQLAV